MNIVSAIDCFTGYGITGYNIWKQLYKNNKNTTLFNIGNPNLEPTWDRDSVLKSIRMQEQFDRTSPVLKVWHQYDLLMRPCGSSLYAGLSFFEIDKLSNKDKVCYMNLDHIFLPSEWARQILIDNGIDNNMSVVPQGVDTDIFDASVPEDKTNDKYIFINIGKWEKRKGHDILIEIFNNAFSDDDDVELWMVNHNPFLTKDKLSQWHTLYHTSKLKNKIRIFPRIPTQKALSKIMSYADCGIFPSRGEGWNNEAIEMMAMNKPLIITNYSAHTQYCTKNNTYLIDIDSLEKAEDDMWFDGSGNWASIDDNQIEQAVSHMRYVYENQIRENPAGLQTANSHSWTKTVNSILDVMNS